MSVGVGVGVGVGVCVGGVGVGCKCGCRGGCGTHTVGPAHLTHLLYGHGVCGSE